MFKIIFGCILVMLSIQCKSQKKYCESLRTLLNSEDVTSHFKLSSIDNFTIFLIDRSNSFAGCEINNWGGRNLKVIYDSSISASLNKVLPYTLFKEKCNYFIIMEFSFQGDNFHYGLLNPCSGLLYTADLKKEKSGFIIVNIRKGVI